MVKAVYSWKPISRRPIKTRWVDDVRKDIHKLKYQIGRLLPKTEEDGGSWLRRPKLYKSVVEPHKKRRRRRRRRRGRVIKLHQIIAKFVWLLK
jgi:hypothetical protein